MNSDNGIARSVKISEGLTDLSSDYLFTAVQNAAETEKRKYPKKRFLHLGIGDVTLPLSPAVTEALNVASKTYGSQDTFHGYPPSDGYFFLREAVAAEYGARGISISPDEVSVSDGAKSDIYAVLTLFSSDTPVMIPDPGYPAYRDAAVLLEHPIIRLYGNAENAFCPLPGRRLIKPSIIIICSPGNPTGTVYSREDLQYFVNFALQNDSIILFDAAYADYIGKADYPHSIYEIPRADTCAVEIGSFSKSHGFTGLRCGYTVIPEKLHIGGKSLLACWKRRHAAVFNGVSYLIQSAAMTALSPRGKEDARKNIGAYLKNASLLREALEEKHVRCYGGKMSPYVFFRVPNGETSIRCFTRLLCDGAMITTPGYGFGVGGEGYIRLSAFLPKEDAEEAAKRLKELL